MPGTPETVNWTDFLPDLDNANVWAFLRVIRQGETDQTDRAYRMMFGGSLFAIPPDVPKWDHPRMLHTFDGLSSTAAGAYQILMRTWDNLVGQYEFPDFSPTSQDLAAIALIYGRDAIQDIRQGNVSEGIRKCCQEWASLPYSPYGQPRKSLAQAMETFTDYGGRIA